MNNVFICIPARYASTRLPGKPLLQINNKTIIEHVYLNACQIKGISNTNIIILTDNQKIYDEVQHFGGNCYISKQECANGSERIYHFLKENNINSKFIVNIQGDEPFFDIQKVDRMIEQFIGEHQKNKINVCGTLFYKTKEHQIINSCNKVKLIINNNNHVLYGSRNIIPGNKQNKILSSDYSIHIGIFIFEKNYLTDEYYGNTTFYQEIEDLEWLKILEQDYKIIAYETQFHEVGVDTMDDYYYLKNKYEIKK